MVYRISWNKTGASQARSRNLWRDLAVFVSLSSQASDADDCVGRVEQTLAAGCVPCVQCLAKGL